MAGVVDLLIVRHLPGFLFVIPAELTPKAVIKRLADRASYATFESMPEPSCRLPYSGGMQDGM